MAAHRSATGDSGPSPALDDTSGVSGLMPWMVCEKLNDFCTSTTYATMPNTMQAEMMDGMVASAAMAFVKRPKFAPSSVPHDAIALPQANKGNALTVFFAPSAMSTKYMRISKKPVPHDSNVLTSEPFAVTMDTMRNPATGTGWTAGKTRRARNPCG